MSGTELTNDEVREKYFDSLKLGHLPSFVRRDGAYAVFDHPFFIILEDNIYYTKTVNYNVRCRIPSDHALVILGVNKLSIEIALEHAVFQFKSKDLFYKSHNPGPTGPA